MSNKWKNIAVKYTMITWLKMCYIITNFCCKGIGAFIMLKLVFKCCCTCNKEPFFIIWTHKCWPGRKIWWCSYLLSYFTFNNHFNAGYKLFHVKLVNTSYVDALAPCIAMSLPTRQIRTPVLRIPPAVTSQAKMKNWLHECQKWVSHMIGHYAHI